jgi:regulator of protease activity HflC (stomatin/prohibitin superfamily)
VGSGCAARRGRAWLTLALGASTAAVKIVQEHERGVIFRLGRLVDARGPGFFLLIPFADFIRATSLVGQIALRIILGQSDLDHS